MPSYIFDLGKKGIIYKLSQILPAGIYAMNGNNSSVRLDNPTGKQSSVAVVLDDIKETGKEMGSTSGQLFIAFMIAATSEEDMLGLVSILFSEMNDVEIPVYSAYQTVDQLMWTPAVGSTQINTLKTATMLESRFFPEFNTEREKFFWQAQVITSFDFIGAF